MQGVGDEFERRPHVSSALSTASPWHIPWIGQQAALGSRKDVKAMENVWHSALVLLLALLLSFSSPATAQIPGQALSFEAWKESQINDATTQMFKVSSRISQLRSGKPPVAGQKDNAQASLTSARFKTADGDPLSLAEKDLRRAKESLETANNLMLSDYVAIYLPTLESQPDALQRLIERTPKEELGEIVKALLLKSHSIDAKRNSSVISGLSPTN